MPGLAAKLLKCYQQGQYHGKVREYFYYISHEGFLFLDDSRMKNFTAAYRDQAFLNFFYKNLRLNTTERYQDSFKYMSKCGRENNYLRCDDRPVVYTAFSKDSSSLLIGGSSISVDFQPDQLFMLENGRLYHPSPFDTFGLVKATIADTLFPSFTFDKEGYPSQFHWKGMTSDSSVWAPRKSQNSTIDSTQYDVDNQIVFCVKDFGSNVEFTEEERRTQNDLFQKLHKANVEPEWIAGSSCLRVSEKDPNFYVFPSFRGPAFEYLNNRKVKVIGASLVIQCLAEGRAIPKWTHPIFSMNLSGAVVCFTGLQPEIRNQLSDLVRWMDGIVSKSFTSNVTHLVADKCESNAPKYKVARQLRIPVMSPSWLEEGWVRASQLVVEQLTSPPLIKANTLPLFTNLVLCTSGIAGQDRSDMGRLIELYGGRNPGDMKRNECTHLIMEGTSGPKYRKAREWGQIHIVEPRWLRKSVEEGYLLNEKLFDPSTPHLRSSTQAPNGIPPPVDLDFSSIYGSAKIPNPSQSFSAAADKEKVEKTNTPATATRPKFIRRESCRQISNLTSIVTDPIDNLSEMSYRGDFDFLEGCLIWLCGVQESRIEKWKRVLDRCGATRVIKPENATHIVVLNGTEDRKVLLDAQKHGIVIVQPEWVIECVQRKDLLPVDDFVWSGESNVTKSTTNSIVANSVLSDYQQNDIEIAREDAVTTAGTTTALNLSLRSHSSSSNASCSRSQLETNKVQNKLFEGLKFRFCGLPSELTRFWSLECCKASGVVLADSDHEVADYMIYPQVEYGVLLSPLIGRYRYLVTECWLKSCMARVQVVDRKSHPLFRPIPAVQGTTLFNGVVVGFLALESYEKGTYVELLQMFGGRVESSVVARPKNGVLPCTHLIPGCRNHKIIECSRKIQRMKIVDPSWIIECIVNDKLLPTEHFPIETVAYASYEGRTDDLWVERLPVTHELDELPSSTMTVDEVDNYLLGDEIPTVDSTFEVTVSQVTHEHSRSKHTSMNKHGLKLELKGVTQVLEEIITPVNTDNESTFNSLSVSGVGKVLAEAAVKASVPFQRSSNELLDRSDREFGGRDSVIEMPHVYSTRSRRSIGSPPMSIEEAMPFMQNREISEKSRQLVEQQLIAMREDQQREEERRAEEEARRLAIRRRKRCFDITDSPQPKRIARINEDDCIDWQPQPAPLLRINHSPGRQNIFRSTLNPSSVRSVGQTLTTPRINDEVIATTSSVRTVSSTYIDFKNDSSGQTSQTRVLTPINSVQNQFSRTIEAKTSEQITRHNSPKNFLFTSMADLEEKNNLMILINRLGGVTDSQDKNELTEESTHLICGKLVRGTKLMGFIAAGKWVLTVDFIERSAAAGRWLDEDEFEWSHPNMLAKYKLQGRELQIALACKRWRNRIENMRLSEENPAAVGAFSGKRFILYCKKEKAAGLVPLMEAGKAVVSTREQIPSLRTFNPTHAIVCNYGWNERELSELHAMGVKVYALEYIAKYLLEDSMDDASCYHSDYALLLTAYK
ncbi:unnamed protein product [Auanema sp. JU1783]|nr:unnamed protein product [Auanema sp. JU1783]